jgi:hypothetical protein
MTKASKPSKKSKADVVLDLLGDLAETSGKLNGRSIAGVAKAMNRCDAIEAKIVKIVRALESDLESAGCNWCRKKERS